MIGGAALLGLGHRYAGARDDDWALRGVTLNLFPGEVLAVVGPSGSGKTTLLRLVCGLLTPTAGLVVIGGQNMTLTPPEQRRVAMVFQGFALFPHLTVKDNIAFGPRVRREPRAEADRRVAEAAELLGLTALLDRRPGQLSGGERQRVALARALVRDPLVFCLDEPLSSLDPVLRTEARRALYHLLRADGRCALYVTHDQAEAVTVGDRVLVLRDGVDEQVGTPRELYEAPATAFVAGFLGSPPMSLLSARAAALMGLAAAPDQRVGVRAEAVTLAAGDVARVDEVEDLGHELHVVLDVAGEPLVARVRPGDEPVIHLRFGVAVNMPVVGTRVGVAIDPRGVRVFSADGYAVP